jgi:hypothetical protein
MEEATASQAQRIAPLEDGPFTLFEDVLHDANHLGRGETGREHLSDGGSTVDRGLNYLVIDGVFSVEISESVNVGSIECLDPGTNELAWSHAL